MDISISVLGDRHFLVCGDAGAVPIDSITQIEFRDKCCAVHFDRPISGPSALNLNERLKDDLRNFLDDHRLNLMVHRLH